MKKILLLIGLTFLGLVSISDAVCQTFDIYVSDGGNFNNPPWKILKFDENGENPDTFIIEELAWPQDIVFLEDQDAVIISNLNTGRITKYDSETGAYLEDFASGIGGPTRMKIGADSLLYVLQWSGNGTVKRYQLDGTFMDDFTSTAVSNSIGLDWDIDGNLYVSSYNGNFIRKFDNSGNDLGVFISSNLQGPTNIWFDETGDLFANNWNGSTVSRFDSDGNFIEAFITGLGNPEGVAFFPNGNILVGNGGTSAVKLFDADGNFIEDIVASGAGGLILPNAVILREKSTVSLSKIESETKFIQPTIGTVFYIQGLEAGTVESIAVYDALGKLVAKKAVSGNVLFEADHSPEGTYIITVRSVDGRLFSQKVMVKR